MRKGSRTGARAVKEQDWLGDRRLVLFDQRGVGASQILPSSCGRLNRYTLFEIADHTWLSREEGAAAFKDSADRCWASFRENGYDPGRITTAAIAADVADLREALSYPAWNLWAVSFGSRVGLTVMRDHPEGLRSVILDGVWPPEANFYDYAAKIGEAFDALIRACRIDLACSQGYPDLERRFLALADRLDASPLLVPLFDSEPARIDGWTLRDLTDQMLMSAEQARLLPRLVAEVESGNYRLLAQNKETEVTEFFNAEHRYDQAVYVSIACAETFPADPDWVAKARSRDPRFADQVWDPAADGYCAAWPVPRTPASDAAPVTSDIPTLLISGAFDPRTPPSWAEATSKRLTQGYSYVFPGYGHGVFDRGHPCAQRIAGRFLDDPTRRPDDDCFANLALPVFEPPSR
jgi:pimeloyl-ACP methyl ester carboxylesterase